MTTDSLMQRLIDNGVDIHNFQAVFDFIHSQSGNGGGLTEADVSAIFGRLSSGLATSDQLQLLQAEIQNQIGELPILSSIEIQNMISQATANSITQSQLIDLRDSLNARIDNFDLSGYVQSYQIMNMVFQSDLGVYALKTELMQFPTRTEYNLKADLSLLDGKADKSAVQIALDSKLDRSEFHQHFRGLFSSVESLEQGVNNPIAGDYANVDAGVGKPTEIFAYDVDDNVWRKQGSTGLSVSSSDNVPEGNANLYFTTARVQAVISGMSTSSLSEGVNLYFTNDRVKTVVRGMNTDDLPEGVNSKYYTDQRVLDVVNPILGNIEALLAQILGA